MNPIFNRLSPEYRDRPRLKTREDALREKDAFLFVGIDEDARSLRTIGGWPTFWKDEDYDFVDTATTKQIGWEFLRRNPAYILDYYRFRTTPQSEREDIATAINATYGLNQAYRPPAPNQPRPPILDGEDLATVDPVIRIVNDKGAGVETPLPEKGNFFDARIDLDRPLEPQIQKIRSFYGKGNGSDLEKRSHKSLRILPREFRRYLRVLDAKANLESNWSIINELYADKNEKELAQDTLSRNYKRAREIATTGFQNLFARSRLE